MLVAAGKVILLGSLQVLLQHFPFVVRVLLLLAVHRLGFRLWAGSCLVSSVCCCSTHYRHTFTIAGSRGGSLFDGVCGQPWLHFFPARLCDYCTVSPAEFISETLRAKLYLLLQLSFSDVGM
jgi:hypothetical protein